MLGVMSFSFQMYADSVALFEYFLIGKRGFVGIYSLKVHSSLLTFSSFIPHLLNKRHRKYVNYLKMYASTYTNIRIYVHAAIAHTQTYKHSITHTRN